METRASTNASPCRSPGLRVALLLASVATGTAIACAEPRVPEEGEPIERYCTDCHAFASPTDDRPWSAYDEASARTHRAHVEAREGHDAVPCEACHDVPDDVFAEGHFDSDLPAEVRLGEVSAIDGTEPEFDPVTRTCADVSCHTGGLANPAARETPPWGAEGEFGCAGCHGSPPEAPHPQSDACGRCHSGVMDEAGAFVAVQHHMDGVIEPMTLTCDSCHGSAESDAPPHAVMGEVSATSRGVGAHQAHLAPSAWHARIDCEDCHRVPDDVFAEGHFDTVLPAELTWGPRATANGALEPRFDEETLSCAQVYCHGGHEGGGTAPEPVWTRVDGTQARCGSCHALPPTEAHPDRDDCVACHDTVDDNGNIVAPDRHVDGVVDGPGGCNSCHGSPGDPADPLNQAPPNDTHGNITPDAPGVGAHRLHLAPSDWHATVTCAQCHIVPEGTWAPGHVDDTPNDSVAWTPASIAGREGAVPSYDYETNTCSGVYCHGGGLDDAGATTTPVWTVFGEEPAACGTACHSLPPAAPHPPASACADCHSAVIDRSGRVICASLHVNGIPDLGPIDCR